MGIVRKYGLLVGMVGAFLLPGHIFAVSTPSAADIQVFQGETHTIEIPVENDATNEQEITFSFAHVRFDDQGNPVLEQAVDDVFWLSISQSSIHPQEGETRFITVTASPPEEVASGSYVFALLATETREGPLALTHGTATLVFITVGSVKSDARCVSFFRNDDGTFSHTFQNVGQGILYDEGEVVLRGPFGIALAATPSNPSRHRIFAGQTRAWTSESMTIPWWTFGPRSFSLESDHLSSACSRISAGFGWIPFVAILAGIGGIFVVRRWK